MATIRGTIDDDQAAIGIYLHVSLEGEDGLHDPRVQGCPRACLPTLRKMLAVDPKTVSDNG